MASRFLAPVLRGSSIPRRSTALLRVLGCRHLVSASCASPTRLLTANLDRANPNPVRMVSSDVKKQGKALVVFRETKHIVHSPLPALVYGLGGLVPFVAAPAYMIICSTYMPDIAFVQMAYGASILSFLGGIRWGFTLPKSSEVSPTFEQLGISVLPSLIAWSGMLLPGNISTLTVIGGLTLMGTMDSSFVHYPPWFRALRFVLSSVAVLCLWTTFICAHTLKQKAETSPEEKKT